MAVSELRNIKRELEHFQLRLLVGSLFILLTLAIVGWRMYQLQVVQHHDLLRQAETNRTAVVPIVPTRGDIVDRNGLVLATNERSYTLELIPERLDRPLEEVLDELSAFIQLTAADRRRFERERRQVRRFESVALRTQLSDPEVAAFAARGYRFPGVEIKARQLRTYPLAEITAHVVGHIGRISQRDKDAIEARGEQANYRGSQVIGKLGVEGEYEHLLHGTTGVEQMEISAGGHAVGQLDRRPAIPGQTVQLSIDAGLQALVHRLYGQRRGSLVAIDPRNGEVLALVSMPGFDSNLFVTGMDQDTWDGLNLSPDQPLLNRSIRGAYPIGSTYKPFMALAGLELGQIDADTSIMDRGSWTFAGHTFRSGHALGRVDMYRSIVKSSNVYYYQLAVDLGVDAIHDFMQPLGFGQIMGIDLPGEKAGILPSKAWKAAAFSKPAQQTWFPGETVSIGIGQGYNNFTMLQLASATASLAAGGVRHRPHLLRASERPDLGSWQLAADPEPVDLGYAPEHVDTILGGMVGVTLEGTSRQVFAGTPYLSGGKTGTAQAISVAAGQNYNAAQLAERQRDHSLYIAFAPADAPTIAVAAIVENAGFGATGAAPIVRRVLDYWIAGLLPTERDLQAVSQGKALAPLEAPLAFRGSVADLLRLLEPPVDEDEAEEADQAAEPQA